MDHHLQARERLRKLPDAQRTAWLDIAEEEFKALGFEAASLNRILTRAAISKGQAYYYFADKAELYRPRRRPRPAKAGAKVAFTVEKQHEGSFAIVRLAAQ